MVVYLGGIFLHIYDTLVLRCGCDLKKRTVCIVLAAFPVIEKSAIVGWKSESPIYGPKRRRIPELQEQAWLIIRAHLPAQLCTMTYGTLIRISRFYRDKNKLLVTFRNCGYPPRRTCVKALRAPAAFFNFAEDLQIVRGCCLTNIINFII